MLDIHNFSFRKTPAQKRFHCGENFNGKAAETAREWQARSRFTGKFSASYSPRRAACGPSAAAYPHHFPGAGSVITVKRAWEELEQAGLILTQAGSGCYVAELPPSKREQGRQQLARDCLAPAVSYCLSLGLSSSEIDAIATHLGDSAPEK